ncbi:MAG: TrmH family RNA methyltransferase [Gaiellaceae bacterium]
MPVISSASNPRLRLVRRLQAAPQRQRQGLFVCEGEDLVEAGLDAGLSPVEVLVDSERPALLERLPKATLVRPELLAELSTLAHAPRVVAVFRREELPRAEEEALPECGLALWRVADPGNVGTLIRSADGLGPCFVALSAGCADPTSPKALRAAAGAVFRVPLCAFERAPGRRIGLVAEGGRLLSEIDLEGPLCFLLGAEREGLPERVAETCEVLATIPLAAEANSLNVAIAGAIALYERLRRRATG